MEIEDEYTEQCYYQNYITSPDRPEHQTWKCQTFIYRYEGILVEMRITNR